MCCCIDAGVEDPVGWLCCCAETYAVCYCMDYVCYNIADCLNCLFAAPVVRCSAATPAARAVGAAAAHGGHLSATITTTTLALPRHGSPVTAGPSKQDGAVVVGQIGKQGLPGHPNEAAADNAAYDFLRKLYTSREQSGLLETGTKCSYASWDESQIARVQGDRRMPIAS
eukprot:CAMPEP_0117659762 /NCGR_PEP_ID=MMETSP0804-20121206/6605_1 /TAXON_ID=1074897 /ORGANISM="Tetraselmis astigmatica, Strain CCMP880" /LENGTH=169 /DNA_ID=CAMNT_0005466441 /DNA_START=134 /DNA_END=645 /DNA_ORIENTATION=+